MVSDLGIISSLRGTDSTGLIVASRKKKNGSKYRVEVQKRLENPCTFLEGPVGRSALLTDNLFLVVGHCRLTTSGAITLTNAHPIQAGKIIGCHNGTINKWAPSKFEEKESSDSRIFMRKFRDLGVEAACKEAEIGAYAVTFVDTEEKTFNIVRNAGRTLFIVMSNDGETMMWASEADFLDLILKREGVRHNWGRVQLCPPHRHYKWKFSERANQGTWTDLKIINYPVIKSSSKGMDDEAYETWLRDNSYMVEGGYAETNKTGVVEDKSDDTRTVCKTCEKLDIYCACETPSVPGMYCKKCKEMIDYCNCEQPSLHAPPPWELDSKARWIPEAAAKHTSVPTIGNKPDDEVEKARTTGSYPPHSPIGQVENWFQHAYDDDTYLGYAREPMAPSIASERLRGGCHICGADSKPDVPVFWYSQYGHVCKDCHEGPTYKEIIGTVSTYLSRYIKGERKHAVH